MKRAKTVGAHLVFVLMLFASNQAVAQGRLGCTSQTLLSSSLLAAINASEHAPTNVAEPPKQLTDNDLNFIAAKLEDFKALKQNPFEDVYHTVSFNQQSVTTNPNADRQKQRLAILTEVIDRLSACAKKDVHNQLGAFVEVLKRERNGRPLTAPRVNLGDTDYHSLLALSIIEAIHASEAREMGLPSLTYFNNAGQDGDFKSNIKNGLIYNRTNPHLLHVYNDSSDSKHVRHFVLPELRVISSEGDELLIEPVSISQKAKVHMTGLAQKTDRWSRTPTKEELQRELARLEGSWNDLKVTGVKIGSMQDNTFEVAQKRVLADGRTVFAISGGRSKLKRSIDIVISLDALNDGRPMQANTQIWHDDLDLFSQEELCSAITSATSKEKTPEPAHGTSAPAQSEGAMSSAAR